MQACLQKRLVILKQICHIVILKQRLLRQLLSGEGNTAAVIAEARARAHAHALKQEADASKRTQQAGAKRKQTVKDELEVWNQDRASVLQCLTTLVVASYRRRELKQMQ